MSPHNSSVKHGHISAPNWRAFAALLMVTLFVATCAKVVAPPGGPADKTPPVILTAEPHSHQTQVPAGNTFIATFSEKIDPTSVNKQFFVSPRQITPPKLKIHGEKLEAILADSFALDQTYVITIGSGVRDLHGNQLGASKSFAFTRGDAIDTSYIAGTVTDGDSPASGVGVALYRKFTPSAIGDMDSLFPDYFTVSGSDGDFELAFLPADRYFILAFRDKDKNQLFQYGVEDFGVTTKKLRVGSEKYPNLELRMQKRDTSEITIISATFNVDGFLRVNLSRKLNPALFASNLDRVRILNATDSALVTSPSVMKDEHGEPTKRHEFLFEEFPAGEYLLAIDFAGLYSDGRQMPEQFVELNHSQAPDTHRPSVESRSVPGRIAPWEALQWSYSFSEPILLDSTSGAVTVKKSEDSLAPVVDTGPVILLTDSRQTKKDYDIILPTSPFELFVTSPIHPVNGERYTLSFNPARVKDLSGNVLTDSLLSDSIDVWPSDSLGSLSMTIENRIDSLYKASYYLRLTRLEGRDYWLTATGADTIHTDLPAGDYVVEVLLDTTKSAVGSLYPLHFAKPRAFYPDTVHIRPRFDTEGIRIILE